MTNEKILLDEKQEEIVREATEKRQNLFYTGYAGTGKSVVLKSIYQTFKEAYPMKNEVVICAPTGVAAKLVKGTTLHRFAGMRPISRDERETKKEYEQRIYEMIINNKNEAVKRWETVKVLMIDEVSMIDPDLFDAMNGAVQRILGNSKLMGGVQVILAGDFCQLPPTQTDKSNKSTKYLFESDIFQRGIPRKQRYMLTKIYRQKETKNQILIQALNDIRENKWSSSVCQLMEIGMKRARMENISKNLLHLFATNKEVENHNNKHLGTYDECNEEHQYYERLDYPHIDGGQSKNQEWLRAQQESSIPSHLFVKVGTPVMLLRNLNDDLINGSMGKVVDFVSCEKWLKQNEKTYQPTYFVSYNEREYKEYCNHIVIPRVKFENVSEPVAIGPIEVEQLINPQENQDTLIFLYIPLRVAYASTIHKSQGMTLERALIDVSHIFEKGQLYVALSRVQSLNGLYIKGFNPNKKPSILMDKKVIEFHRSFLKRERPSHIKEAPKEKKQKKCCQICGEHHLHHHKYPYHLCLACFTKHILRCQYCCSDYLTLSITQPCPDCRTRLMTCVTCKKQYISRRRIQPCPNCRE